MRKKKLKGRKQAADVVFSHFNARGLGPKEELVKMEMERDGVL